MTAYVALHDRRERRHLRQREIPRELTALEEAVLGALQASEQRERDEVQAIANEHNTRGAYHSSFRERAQERARADAQTERERITREADLERARLRDELLALGGGPP